MTDKRESRNELAGLRVPDRGVMWDGHQPTGSYDVAACVEQLEYWGRNTNDDQKLLAAHIIRELAKMLPRAIVSETAPLGPYMGYRAQVLEEAAVLAENWGNAPPNPNGRRAALAAAIRALKNAAPQVPAEANSVADSQPLVAPAAAAPATRTERG